jgi:hypothetical protein
MFGYVNIYKDELKIKDYNLFRAYYCGLCRAVGKRCTAARLALSYDMTFLALLLSAMTDKPPELRAMMCAAHPFHKRAVITEDAAVEYAADMSVLLDFLKLKDDADDDKSVPAFVGMGFLGRSAKRLAKKYHRENGEIMTQLERLSRLERECCPSIDETADCFAKILETLFTPDFITDEAARRSLAWLGYNIGRWIYIIDAFADYEKDLKKNSYNPFIYSQKEYDEIREELRITLTYTLASAASAYELLDIKKNDEILRNIIYIGLKNKQDSILCGREKDNESL